VLLEPKTLQSDLRQDGILAIVTAGRFCFSDPGPLGFSQVVHVTRPQSVTINPAAMPAGTELSFGNFQAGNSVRTLAVLISAGSYTCASTPPADATAGGGLELGQTSSVAP
jgi:hypothetical protein